jgi:hypothetical protein
VLTLLAMCAAAPAASADVVLNEISCDGSDWIELSNTSAGAADVSGWVLTDKALDPPAGDRLVLSNPTVIPAGGHLALERNQPDSFTFGIGCSETIRLGDAASVPVDEVQLPDIDFDLDTWGRYPDGGTAWRRTLPTEGEPNRPSPSGIDEAASLLDPSQVAEVDLEIPPESIAALRDPATWEDYQDGSLTLHAGAETYGPLEVGIRLKGGLGSFRDLDGKAAFKVKLPHSVPGQRLRGLRTLTLNNMVQDPSMVHEALAYEAFRAAGVPAPRTGYAYVRVNGEDYGLYLNVETPDDVMLARWFETTQHLYEGDFGDDVAPGAAEQFQVDQGSEGDLTDIEALIAAVNDPAAPDWSDRVDSVADLSEMTRMWAVEHYIGHWDGNSVLDTPNHPNNYYLHSDATGLFSVLPWGTDQTWVVRSPFDGPSSLMFDDCQADQSCAALYRSGVASARDVIAGLDLDGLATTLAAELAPWQAIDPRREYTLEQIADGVSATRAFIADRPGDADAWLAGPEQVPPPAGPIGDVAGAVSGARPRKRCKRAKRSAKKHVKCRKRKRLAPRH